MANRLASEVFWVNPFTFQLSDKRTNITRQVVVPYADEPDFYSADEMEDIIGHAKENFERDMADKPTHVFPDKAWQHGLGQVLNEIKVARLNRLELGGPKYHVLMMPKSKKERKHA